MVQAQTSGGVPQAAFGHADPRANTDVHFKDTIVGGEFISQQKIVRAIVNEVTDRIIDLEELGLQFKKTEGGQMYYQEKRLGSSYARSVPPIGGKDVAEMPKDLRSFLDDCRQEIPDEVVHVTKEVDPAHYDVTAIIKHLEASKKFPILIFDNPLNLHGRTSEFKLVLNFAISQHKAQIELGLPMHIARSEMAEACLEREKHLIPPIVIDKKNAPVKERVKVRRDVDLYDLPNMRNHEMDGGPYTTMCTIAKERKQGIYNASYHRMEIRSKNTTSHYHSQHHQWIIFRDYEEVSKG